MDNDVLRRGKPTVHVRYGEAQALLAGDACRRWPSRWRSRPERRRAGGDGRRACASCPRALGRCTPAWQRPGHRPGQRRPALDEASCATCTAARPARCCGQRADGRRLQAGRARGMGARRPTAALGLAFQVVDDILDVTADSATLSRPPARTPDNKPTYVSLLGPGRARTMRRGTVRAQAHAALPRSGLADTSALARWPTRWSNG